jgi:hypothetical protein
MESVNVLTFLVRFVKYTRRKELLRKIPFHWAMVGWKKAKPRTPYPSSGIERASSCSWNRWNNTVLWNQKFDNYLWDETQAILHRYTKSPHCFMCRRVQCLLETHTACRMQTAATCSRWFSAPGFLLSTLKMEAIRSYETSVYTISTRRHIPEEGIFHSHRRENIKSYTYCLISYNTNHLWHIKTKTNLSLECVHRGRFKGGFCWIKTC